MSLPEITILMGEIHVSIIPELPNNELWLPENKEIDTLLSVPHVLAIEGSGTNQEVVILTFHDCTEMANEYSKTVKEVRKIIRSYHWRH